MANKKISDLTAVVSLTGTEEFEVNAGGFSKKVTAAQIAAYLGGSGINGSMTTGYIPKATGVTMLGDSKLKDNGTDIELTTGKFRASSTGAAVWFPTSASARMSSNGAVNQGWLETSATQAKIAFDTDASIYTNSTESVVNFAGNYFRANTSNLYMYHNSGNGSLTLSSAKVNQTHNTLAEIYSPNILLSSDSGAGASQYFVINGGTFGVWSQGSTKVGVYLNYNNANDFIVTTDDLAGVQNWFRVDRTQIKGYTANGLFELTSSQFSAEHTTRVRLNSTGGVVEMKSGSGFYAQFSTALLTTTNRTYTFPDASGTFALTASPTFTGNPVLATPTMTSAAVTGTAGAGYIELIAQSSNPAAGSSTGARIFSNSTGAFGWVRKNGTDTYVRQFASTLTADRTYTLPDTSDTFVMLAATQTLTNKRVTPRTVTASDATSITPNTDNADVTLQTNTQAAGTLTINADSGTPTNNQRWTLIVRPTNAQTFSWNANYIAMGCPLPTTANAGKRIIIGFLYDTGTSKWGCVTFNQEA